MYLYFFFYSFIFSPMLWHISKEIMTVRITANVFPVFACFRLPMQNWWDTPDKFPSLLPVKVILFLQFVIQGNLNSKPHRFETEISANLSKNDCSQSKLDRNSPRPVHEVKLTVLHWSLQPLAVSLPQQRNSVQSLGNHRFIYFISLLIFLFHSVTER